MNAQEGYTISFFLSRPISTLNSILPFQTVVYTILCKFILSEMEKGVSFLEISKAQMSLKGGYTDEYFIRFEYG